MADETKQTKDRTLTRLFEHESEPKIRPRADLDVTAVIFQYADNEQSRIELAKVFPTGLPAPCVGRAAAAFGINTSAGNAGNTLESKLAEDIRDAVEGRLELFTEGKWSQERQGGGPRTSILLEAVQKYRADHGLQTDEAKIEEFRNAFSDKERVKQWMADPDFAKVYLQIQLDKRAAKTPAKQAADLLA